MKSRASNFIDAILIHEYDPVAAREYYLRTRKLLGREPGEGADPVSVRNAAKASAESQAAKQKVESERANDRAALQAQLAELEVRVDQLNAAIKQAKAEAMRRAGGVSEETLSRMITAEVKSPGSSKELGKSKDEPAKAEDKGSSETEEKTASQKREAAKVAKEKYEEENPESGNEALQEKVTKTAERLEKLQQRIEAIGRVGA